MKIVYRVAYILIGCFLLAGLAGSVFVKYFGEHMFRSRVLEQLPFPVEVARLEYIFPATFEAREVLTSGRVLIRKARFIMTKAGARRFWEGWFSRDPQMILSGRLVLNGADLVGLADDGGLMEMSEFSGAWSRAELRLDVDLTIDKLAGKATRLRYAGGLELPDTL